MAYKERIEITVKHKCNEGGEVIDKSQLADPKVVAKMLKKYQDWRRGKGPYAWSEDPEKYHTEPFTPEKLGKVIDSAIKHLKSIKVTGSDIKRGSKTKKRR